jgi:GNAT superfamily N-acetyltransferase
MITRPASENDIPAIVELLKASLGESLMPKSEAFWRWKHVDNPFGKSPVILAIENEKIVGVRAFMCWEWKAANKIYRAVRAVDTATHPDFQGKGIFKKLTLALVDQCKAEGVDFIFNTPNAQSKPGYLKMGWQEMGKLTIDTRPVLNFSKKSKDFDSTYSIQQNSNFDFVEQFFSFTDQLVTSRSVSFLKWRYLHNPTIPYHAFSDGKNYLAIFRLKPHSFGTEFRICDFFLSQSADTSVFKKHLFEVVRQSGSAFISNCGTALPVNAFSLPIGPMVTIRPLSTDNFLSFGFWKPTLGDMEVF